MEAPFGKIKLTIEYDGTNYSGWQRQAPGIPTIQSYVEEALEKLFCEPITIIGAGRTDSGVHAVNQVAHFTPPKDPSRYNWLHAFPPLLPPDIVIKEAQVVDGKFHAQHGAQNKTYVYKIWNHPVPSALRARKSWHIRKPLNLDLLNKGAQYLIGTHDFRSFRTEGSAVPDTVRTIYKAKFIKTPEYVEFHITGSGFLKQMVRNIVGTLVQIDWGQRSPESMAELILAKDRKLAGPTAPPQGLYLLEVKYPEN